MNAVCKSHRSAALKRPLMAPMLIDKPRMDVELDMQSAFVLRQEK